MLNEGELAARAALQLRQGTGARYDAPNAPAEDLRLARRGTAFFARKLNELTAADLDGPPLRHGWTRRHLIANVSYDARAVAVLLNGLRTGATRNETAWTPDIELAATLPAQALRALFHHSQSHLNVEWRDLTSLDWDAPITLCGGRQTTPRALPKKRAKTVWLGALDLNNGGRLADLPSAIFDGP